MSEDERSIMLAALDIFIANCDRAAERGDDLYSTMVGEWATQADALRKRIAETHT